MEVRNACGLAEAAAERYHAARRRTARRDLLHCVVGAIGDVDVAAPVDRQAIGCVEAAAKGSFKGGNYNGDLANNGVSLSPFHDFATKIPASVKTELVKLRTGIIAGTVSVDPNSYPVG